MRYWCWKFDKAYANALRRRCPRLGDKWHLDEVFLTIHGERHYLWRAVGQDGNVGFLVGKRYLLHDRDTKCTHAFDALLKDSDVELVILPPRSPHRNAHGERFVRSIKEEALAQMLMLGERALYYAIHQYLTHYHTERNHQGLNNQLIARPGDVGGRTGPVVRRERLGGLLSYSHREVA